MTERSNFLRTLIREDLQSGRLEAGVVTRFPPHPNGFLHIGHAKAICVNFGLAEEFNGRCNLRFDDTNPEKERPAFMDAIKEDILWLGYRWDGEVRHASSYFDNLHAYALHLIRAGLAYVCDLSADQASEYRGTLTEPGRNSPQRERTPEENLDLFERMCAGEFDEGSRSLRARIDMAAANMNMRDPVLYRIRKASHHQTGERWCVYPTYDFAHGQSDALEGISHSLCSLEFEDHRPLYDWFLDNLPVPSRPRQFEFARLKLTHTVTSKRILRTLVDEGHVSDWDDPRMPTIQGLRRRGYTPAALREFCEMIGLSRSNSMVDMAMLEHAIRDDLNENSPRAMCVLDPLRVVISNWPEGHCDVLSAPGHPTREGYADRELPFTGSLWIEREDFREEANKKYKRLVLGKKVRLRNAYVIQANEVIKDADGRITEVHCHYDPDSLGADPADGVKPRGVIHWVSESAGLPATVRLYDRLFDVEDPAAEERELHSLLNRDSFQELTNCWVEPGLGAAEPEQRVQFERLGYFVADRHDHRPDAPVFNRTVGLRDSWAKLARKDGE